jgi:hypothetical protein
MPMIIEKEQLDFHAKYREYPHLRIPDPVAIAQMA